MSIFKKIKIFVLIFGLLLANFGATSLNVENTSALSYAYGVDLKFTFNPTIKIELSGGCGDNAEICISDLAPGTVKDSNTVTVGVSTNAEYGYKLTASVGNENYDGTNITASNLFWNGNKDTDNVFLSVATSDEFANIENLPDNKWAYSFRDIGIDGDGVWKSYSGLRLYSDTEQTVLKDINKNTSQVTDPIEFKIAAKASNDKPSGNYKNVINFTAVANPTPEPQPISCDAEYICYSPNALSGVQFEMGNQYAGSGADTTLLASNFKRDGYGFAGWNTEVDGSGIAYGPNETITTGDLSSSGLALYAMWVEKSSYMQNWGTNECSNLGVGEVVALGDLRDNNAYSITRIGNICLMTENLRLDNSADITESNTNNPSNNFSFEPPENDGWCATFDPGCMDLAMISIENTNSPSKVEDASEPIPNYSYGNYYNYSSATAKTITSSSPYPAQAVGSICPKNWELPSANTLAAINMQFGGDNSLPWRKYPYNFLYSGGTRDGFFGRGFLGYYWTKDFEEASRVNSLELTSSEANPHFLYSNAAQGLAIRCVINLDGNN